MTEDRHHATVGSRQRRRLKASGGSSSSSTHATASSSTQTSTSSSGNSSTHAEASGLRHDDHRDWLSGRAQTSDAPSSERSSQEMQHAVESQIPIKRAPKRARFSTREGLCVYRLVDDMNTPHQIISHWLVEQALLGRQSMKMLKLRPLFPPTANTLDVPAVETVSLHDRFKSVWEAHNFDPVLDELESTCRTAINGGLYDAHICAVKQQARSSKVSECLMFHQLRWGHGNVACAPTPPELEV